FKEKLPNLMYARNPSPIGAALGFRRAAELASGEYVLNFSDDDLLADGALDAFVSVIQSEKADMVYTDLAVIDQDGRQKGVWGYREYSDRAELLRCLLDKGGNVIPEVLLVRRELYDKYYGEYYARRFITPFYLPGLGKLVLRHIPKALYKYRIHRKSTFGDVEGLIIRNKGVTNFMNLILFMYPPEEIFGFGSAGAQPERLAAGIEQFVQRLLYHGERFFSGDFYTGASYGKQHNLWVIFYEYARRWLALARSYGVLGTELAKLEQAVAREYDPAALDPTAINLLPDVYRKLPWFSYRPINVVTEFIPFDMVTLGEHPALAEERYSLHREGAVDIWATNRVFETVDDMMAHLESHPAQVVNLANAALAAKALGALAARGKAYVFVVDMTGGPAPITHESMRHGTRVDPKTILNFENHLTCLRG
ncbi:MAG: glycosyltransferase, partial [Pseudomonadota bacterium]